MCIAIDEMRIDARIVGYMEALLEKGLSLEESVKIAASNYGKTEEYVREVYEEADAE